MMQAPDILLILDASTINPTPPPERDFWIDNLGNQIITNTGQSIVFNPG